MLDRHVVPHLRKPLGWGAEQLQHRNITANSVTVAGFVVGVTAVAALAFEAYTLALLLLLCNRLADGLDGELARRTQSSDGGAFLDITLDFIFYAVFPLGFALADPASNALPAAILVASFVGTGASFLAFSSLAQKRGIEHPDFAYKGLYYLNGLAEGTETILCFALMCLLPDHFALLAYGFAIICVITAVNRVVFGYLTLR